MSSKKEKSGKNHAKKDSKSNGKQDSISLEEIALLQEKNKELNYEINDLNDKISELNNNKEIKLRQKISLEQRKQDLLYKNNVNNNYIIKDTIDNGIINNLKENHSKIITEINKIQQEISTKKSKINKISDNNNKINNFRYDRKVCFVLLACIFHYDYCLFDFMI